MIDFFFDPGAPVQPDQYQTEFNCLLKYYEQLAPRRVLEIGVREGGSLYQWIKRKPEIVVAVDDGGMLRWGNDGKIDPGKWQEWADYFGVELVTIIGDSHDPHTRLQVAEHKPFDFIFIDGDHSAGGVEQDLSDYLPMARLGGIVALHDILPDYSDPGIGVWQAWERLRESGALLRELYQHENQGNRGIGMVYV